MVVTATYSPVSAGTFSRDHYEIVTVGGNKVGKQTCAATRTVKITRFEGENKLLHTYVRLVFQLYISISVQYT